MPAILAMILRLIAGSGGQWAAVKGLGALAGKAGTGALGKVLGHGATKFGAGIGGFMAGDAAGGYLTGDQSHPGPESTIDTIPSLMLQKGPGVAEREKIMGVLQDEAELRDVLENGLGVKWEDFKALTTGGLV